MSNEHIKAFSRNARTYDDHTRVQKGVARHLVQRIQESPQTIMDLGCGGGEVLKNIEWAFKSFVGVDSSVHMSASHPRSEHISILHDDFEAECLYEAYPQGFDLIISSSALQWAKDLTALFPKLARTSNAVALAIFTDKTFETLYALSGLKTFLPNAQALIELAQVHFECTTEIKTYRIVSKNTRELFGTIKRSGVSGGEKRLGVTQMRQLMREYPYDYLECEVVFIWGRTKQPLREQLS